MTYIATFTSPSRRPLYSAFVTLYASSQNIVKTGQG